MAAPTCVGHSPPSFFLGTSLQSRRARHANPQCLQSAVPGIDFAQSGRQGHRNAETSRWLGSLESKEVYSGWGVQGQMTNFDEFMIHCILHPKMNVGSFNKPDFTIQKKNRLCQSKDSFRISAQTSSLASLFTAFLLPTQIFQSTASEKL